MEVIGYPVPPDEAYVTGQPVALTATIGYPPNFFHNDTSISALLRGIEFHPGFFHLLGMVFLISALLWGGIILPVITFFIHLPSHVPIFTTHYSHNSDANSWQLCFYAHNPTKATLVYHHLTAVVNYIQSYNDGPVEHEGHFDQMITCATTIKDATLIFTGIQLDTKITYLSSTSYLFKPPQAALSVVCDDIEPTSDSRHGGPIALSKATQGYT